MNKDLQTDINIPLPLPTKNVWLLQLQQSIITNLADSQFSVSILAKLMQMSSRNLHYKVKKVTGFSPGKYINELRLQRAVQLLQNQSFMTVSEVCYAVGFQKPAYFSLLFKRRFKVLPSRLLRNGKGGKTFH